MKQMDVRSIRSGLYIVKPIRSNSIKGSMSVKDLLYKDLNEKVKLIDFKNLTEADKVILEKWKAVANMDVKIKSFLPDTYKKELDTLEAQANNLFKSLCISDSCNYMTKKNWKKLQKDIKPFVQTSNALINRIVDNWPLIKLNMVKTLFEILEGKFDKEELSVLVDEKLPTPARFAKSYENLYCYTLTPLTTSMIHVDCTTDEIVGGDEYFLSEFKLTVKKDLDEALTVMDEMQMTHFLYGKAEFAGTKKKQLRPRRRIKALVKELARITDAFKDETLIEFKNLLEKISEEKNDFILYEDIENLSYKIINFMYQDFYLEKDEYPSLSYYTKEKYTEAKRMFEDLAENRQASMFVNTQQNNGYAQANI